MNVLFISSVLDLWPWKLFRAPRVSGHSESQLSCSLTCSVPLELPSFTAACGRIPAQPQPLTDILLQHLLTITFLCFAIVIPTTDVFLINHWIYSNLNVRRSKWMHSPWSCSGKMSSHLSHYNRLYFHFVYFPFLAEFQATFQFPNQAAS